MTVELLVGYLFAAVLGACLGSFANVLILRWHEAAPLTGRSRCPKCERVIPPQHLIPILSWFLLRGRCASCKKKIHVQYPLVEAAALLLAVVVAYRHPPLFDTARFFVEFVITLGLIVPVVMDIRWQELPLEYLIGLGIFALVARVVLAWTGHQAIIPLLMDTGIALFGAIIFFGAQVVFSRGAWMGEGDIWFAAMMALILGAPALTGIAIYLAYIIGGVIALIGLATKTYTRKSRIPFAPALAAGTILAIWHGTALFHWMWNGLF